MNPSLFESSRAALHMARKACEAELMCRRSGTLDADSYNAGVRDCIRAIESLIAANLLAHGEADAVARYEEEA